MGTADVESALVLHKCVAESADVGMPHEIKGQCIYAYVTLNAGVDPSEELRRKLADGCGRKSAISLPPTPISLHRPCPRHVPASSCGASFTRPDRNDTRLNYSH